MPGNLQQIDLQVYSKTFLSQGFRRDGRGFDDCRPTVVNVNSICHADGSSIVRLGKTTACCGIVAELARPKADTPNEGFLVVNVELTPLCSPACPPGPPSDEAMAATAMLERALKSTEAIDLRSLCIVPGHLAWVIYLDICCLGLDGAFLAAAMCAATAALKSTSLPAVEMDVETGAKTVRGDVRTPLPVNATPFASTFAIFDEGILQDPTAEEEMLSSGLVTAVVCEEPERALPLFMPGSRPLEPEDLAKCTEAARQRARHLSQLLHVAVDSPER